MQQKIVITGGPSTGKSTVLNELIKRNFNCMPEISREVTLLARQKGIEQLFLTDPLLFSKMLLDGRVKQYQEAENLTTDIVFFDRGIPDVHAYMNYLGVDYPSTYHELSVQNQYSRIFLMPPWENIYITDNERYESFEQSLAIHNHLKKAYIELGYQIQEVPFGSVEKRTNFILDTLNISV